MVLGLPRRKDDDTVQCAEHAIGGWWQKERCTRALTTRLGLPIHGCYRHGMFSHITESWGGRPLVSCEVVVALRNERNHGRLTFS